MKASKNKLAIGLLAVSVFSVTSIAAEMNNVRSFSFVVAWDEHSDKSFEGFQVKALSSNYKEVHISAPTEQMAYEMLGQRIEKSRIEYNNTLQRIQVPSELVVTSRDVAKGITTATVNDPYYEYQQNYKNKSDLAGAGELAKGIAYQKEQRRKVRIAVLDTGLAPHEDLVVRGGHNFSTMFGQVENENYLDRTIIEIDDETKLECTSGHGTSMASVIGATSNNGVGMFGLVDADIYMGRVASTDCNASPQEDVAQITDLARAIIWASESESSGGVDADVINISLAGKEICPRFLQDAIDQANDNGKVVVVAVGNEADSANAYTPANCDNVIAVGANTIEGDGTSYTNRGDVVDITTLGDDTVALPNNQYAVRSGTSISTAYVTGIIGRLKENFPFLTTSNVEWLLKNSASEFSVGSGVSCEHGCGAGIANLEGALSKAELTYDPYIDFKHPYADELGNCSGEESVEALKSFIPICKTVVANVELPYVEQGVNYKLRLLRKPKAATWHGNNDSVEVLKEIDQSGKLESLTTISIGNVDIDEYDYGVVSCDNEQCPSIAQLNMNQIVLPDACN